MKYAYSPLLRAPDRAIDVDMEKPAVVRMMKAMGRARQKELSPEWTRQRGVRLERTEYPGLDGEKIPLFVITPAEENAGGTEPGGGEPVGARDDGTHDETKVGGGEPVGVRDGMRGGCPAMIYLHGGAFALPVQAVRFRTGCGLCEGAADAGISPGVPSASRVQRRDNLGRLSCPVALAGQRRERRKVCAGQRTYAALRGERRGSAGGGTDALAAGSEKKAAGRGASGLSGLG